MAFVVRCSRLVPTPWLSRVAFRVGTSLNTASILAYMAHPTFHNVAEPSSPSTQSETSSRTANHVAHNRVGTSLNTVSGLAYMACPPFHNVAEPSRPELGPKLLDVQQTTLLNLV